MGLNVGLNALTSGGLVLATVLLVVAGILLVSAASKVRDIPEFEESSGLKKAENDLKTAYILMFIAAGVTLLLAVAYGGHEVAWCPSEWIHGIIYLLLVAIIVIAVIYAYIVLNDLYTPELADRNGSTAFIWASLLIGSIGFMVVMATASGRVGYNASMNDIKKRWREVERKVHESHSSITGQVNDFETPMDRCAKPPTSPAPMPEVVAVVSPPPQSVPSPRANYQPVNVPLVQQQQRFAGPPTVTQHTVTSQPIVTTSTTTSPALSPAMPQIMPQISRGSSPDLQMRLNGLGNLPTRDF